MRVPLWRKGGGGNPRAKEEGARITQRWGKPFALDGWEWDSVEVECGCQRSGRARGGH